MGGFKAELLARLHNELDCFLRFYPFVMASYLNINFKGRLVDPARLSEGKEILVMEMCDAAVKFGFYSMPTLEATTDDAETVIEDSQPPLDDFDLLVTQLSQSQRPEQPNTIATSTTSPIEARKS